MKRFILPILLSLLLCACEQQVEQKPTLAQKPVPEKAMETSPPEVTKAIRPTVLRSPFKEPLEAVRVEFASEAIPYWRDAISGQRPPLMVYSINPFLQSLDEEQRQEIAPLLASGTAEDFIQRGSYYRANPAILANQAVSAAFEAGLFSRLIWVFPSESSVEKLSLEAFRQKAVQLGVISEEESLSLQFNDGVFFGTVQGLPFQAIHPSAVDKIVEPVALHIDLSFFKGLYKSDIKTPLYPMLMQTCKSIQKLELSTSLVTLSYSTQERDLSLATRFLINRLAVLLAKPSMLDQDLPPSWNLHAEAIYTLNFFLETKVDELYQQAATIAPDDPAILYGLALRLFRNKELHNGIKLLNQAAQQDPGYAVEFLVMADRASASGDIANVIMLLELARQHLPQIPFIELQLANAYLKRDSPFEARQILQKLKTLPWSSVTHPNILPAINDLLEKANSQSKA